VSRATSWPWHREWPKGAGPYDLRRATVQSWALVVVAAIPTLLIARGMEQSVGLPIAVDAPRDGVVACQASTIPVALVGVVAGIPTPPARGAILEVPE
jgi:hypothetical protein